MEFSIHPFIQLEETGANSETSRRTRFSFPRNSDRQNFVFGKMMCVFVGQKFDLEFERALVANSTRLLTGLRWYTRAVEWVGQ